MPKTPSAISSPREPEQMVSTPIERSFLPSVITGPWPNCRSIWESAADRALVLSMEDPSTIRRAVADIGRAPYGGDSLAGQTGGQVFQGRRRSSWNRLVTGNLYHLCSPFAICSFWVLAPFPSSLTVNGPL